jgi:hypothetical protein
MAIIHPYNVIYYWFTKIYDLCSYSYILKQTMTSFTYIFVYTPMLSESMHFEF